MINRMAKCRLENRRKIEYRQTGRCTSKNKPRLDGSRKIDKITQVEKKEGKKKGGRMDGGRKEGGREGGREG